MEQQQQQDDENDKSEVTSPPAAAAATTEQSEEKLDVEKDQASANVDIDTFVPGKLSRKGSQGLPSLQGSFKKLSEELAPTISTADDDIAQSSPPGDSPGLVASLKSLGSGEFTTDIEQGANSSKVDNDDEEDIGGVQTIADMSEEVEESLVPDEEGGTSEEYSQVLPTPPLRYQSTVGGSLGAVPENETMAEEDFEEEEHEDAPRPPRSARSMRPGPDKRQSSNWSVSSMWKQGSSVFFIQWQPEEDEEEIDLTLCEVISNFLISTYRKNEVFILVLAAILFAKAYPPLGANYVCREWTASYIAVMFIFGKSERNMYVLDMIKFVPQMKRASHFCFFFTFISPVGIGIENGEIF